MGIGEFVKILYEKAKSAVGYLRDAAAWGLGFIFGSIAGWIYYFFLLVANIGKKRTELSQCLKNVLGIYFPSMKLNDVRIVESANGVPEGKLAVTIGHDIFCKGSFSDDNHDNLWLLFHELVHVRQYEAYTLGVEAFFVNYVFSELQTLFNNDKNSMEKEAEDYVIQKFSLFEQNYQKQCNPSYTPSYEIDSTDWAWLYY